MSSKTKKLEDKITQQRLTAVVQVLSILSSETAKMSWLQRLKLSWTFLWKKNIDCFFALAGKNRGKELKNDKVQDSGQE